MLRELQDERIDELDELEPADEPLEIADEVALRRALIRIQQLERDEAQVKARRDAIVATYDRDAEHLAEQREFLRRSVASYLERLPAGQQKVRFPDVGTAYLGRTDPKIEVEDKDALQAAVGSMFVREVFDLPGAKAYALERATTDGEIVAGTKLVPGGPGLRIRKA
jgi:hypothetical protein